MGCRKIKLERRWGKEYVEIAMGGYVPCGYCGRVHTPDEHVIEVAGKLIQIEGEPNNEEKIIIS